MLAFILAALLQGDVPSDVQPFVEKNTTVLASMTLKGMGSSLAVEGATSSKVCLRPTWSGSSRQAYVRVRW